MKKQPQRMCVTCKTRRDKKDLLRIVLNADGSVSYDPTGKASGRGCYLCKNSKCIEEELKAHRISKGLRHGVAPEEIKQLAEDILKLVRDSGDGEGDE